MFCIGFLWGWLLRSGLLQGVVVADCVYKVACVGSFCVRFFEEVAFTQTKNGANVWKSLSRWMSGGCRAERQHVCHGHRAASVRPSRINVAKLSNIFLSMSRAPSCLCASFQNQRCKVVEYISQVPGSVERFWPLWSRIVHYHGWGSPASVVPVVALTFLDAMFWCP